MYRPQTCGDPFWYPKFPKKNPLHFRVYAKTNLKKNLATKTSKTFKLKREKPEIDHFQFKIHTQPKPERQKSGVPEKMGNSGYQKGSPHVCGRYITEICFFQANSKVARKYMPRALWNGAVGLHTPILSPSSSIYFFVSKKSKKNNKRAY